jgi:hypothetical protein
MDYISLGFYAAVCGLLSLVAPGLGNMLARLGIGALVGIVAAALLPAFKGMTGY